MQLVWLIRLSLLVCGPMESFAQDWFHLPEMPGPLGDYTEAERKVLRRVDPNIEGSRTALDSHTNTLRAILREGMKPMPNTEVFTPDEWAKRAHVKVTDPVVKNVHGTNVLLTDHGLQPATQTAYSAYWNLQDRPRRFVLLVEDMIEDYRPYVGYLILKVTPLIDVFRQYDLPIFWSNWLRRPDDGLYGALDRFYGPRGIKSKQNPAYVFAKNGSVPMAELMPNQREVYLGRMIHSAHLSKFSDVDEHGQSLFWKELKHLGVDTLVVLGAWTEDCIIATAFDAADKYNLDVVIVSDAVGTPSPSGFAALEVMSASVAKLLPAANVTEYLAKHGGDDAYVRRALGDVSLRSTKVVAGALAPLCAVAFAAACAFGHLSVVAYRRRTSRDLGDSLPLLAA